MRIQQCGVVVIALLTGLFVAHTATAALTLTENGEIPIANGTNVLAAMAINDSPGSSDLTLIIQIEIGGDIVLDEDHECFAIMPTENIPDDGDPAGWTAPNFDDGDWDKGEYGIGYGDGDDNFDIGDGSHAAVYSRAYFDVSGTGGVVSLILGADYDDGCVIWINGVEVARASGMDTGEFPHWEDWTDQGGGQSHEASKTDPPTYETVEAPVKIVGSILAVEAADRLVTTWGDIRRRY
jgi:hypothetical protein